MLGTLCSELLGAVRSSAPLSHIYWFFVFVFVGGGLAEGRAEKQEKSRKKLKCFELFKTLFITGLPVWQSQSESGWDLFILFLLGCQYGNPSQKVGGICLFCFYWVASMAIPIGKWVGFVRFIFTKLPVWQSQSESGWDLFVLFLLGCQYGNPSRKVGGICLFYFFFPCR